MKKIALLLLTTLVLLSCSELRIGQYESFPAGSHSVFLNLYCDSTFAKSVRTRENHNLYYGKWTVSEDTLVLVFNPGNRNDHNLYPEKYLCRGKKLLYPMAKRSKSFHHIKRMLDTMPDEYRKDVLRQIRKTRVKQVRSGFTLLRRKDCT